MSPAVRPPQQSRSLATRARLVEAAARALVDLGFAGASTSAMAQRAGVSQGALFKHFPAKADLLAACVERLLADFVVEFRADVVRRLAAAPSAAGTRLPPQVVLTAEARVAPAVAARWAIFRRPAMHAVFEVYVAARTDAALAERLAPILTRHREAILAEARLLFPEVARHAPAEADAAVDAVVYAMQGVALGLFAPDDRVEAEQLAFFTRLAEHELGLAITAARGPKPPRRAR
jgi:AcrR family transcriptional regulator